MAFKCPVSGCEDSGKEFQTEAMLKSSSTYWFSHVFHLTFYNEETRVLFYDKRQLAYICVRDKAVAGHVIRFTTFPSISYGDGENTTKR